MEYLATLKTEIDDFEVEYEIEVIRSTSNHLDIIKKEINNTLDELDANLEEKEKIIYEYNSRIDDLLSKADGKDYLFAVMSGIISGTIDIFLVDDFSFENVNSWGTKEVEEFVMKTAKKKGYKGESLAQAISFLEKDNPIATDKTTAFFGGGRQHHLRDFSHHPTPVGLFFSILTQFTHKVYGTDTNGNFVFTELQEDSLSLIGTNIPEKISFGVIKWLLHLVSDMAGSSSSVAKGSKGTGLPGFFLSTLKEISSLPIFKNDDGSKEVSIWISKLFNGTLLGKRDEKGKLIPAPFDLRTEIGISHHISTQTIPILINECLVRSFYFFRRFYIELKKNQVINIKDLSKLNWKNTLPFKNRTVIRMVAISHGVMSTIDITESMIESAVESGMNPTVFAKNMVVKVNFVGLGKVAFSVASDISMGNKRRKIRGDKIKVMNDYIFLLNEKLYYKQAQVWIEAIETRQILLGLGENLQKAILEYKDAFNDIEDNLNKISTYTSDIDKNNRGLNEEIIDILEWE